MFCKYCGAELKDDAKFCAKCGHSTVNESKQDIEPIQESKENSTDLVDDNVRETIDEAKTASTDEAKAEPKAELNTDLEAEQQEDLFTEESDEELEKEYDDNFNQLEDHISEKAGNKRTEKAEKIHAVNVEKPVSKAKSVKSAMPVNSAVPKTKEPKKGLSKKTLAIAGSIAAALVLIVAISVPFILNAMNFGKLKTKIDTIDTAYDNYILDDFVSDYSMLMSRSTMIISQNQKSKAKAALNDWDEFEEKVKENNKEKVTTYLNDINKLDYSKAYDDELSRVEELKASISACVDQNDYSTLQNDYNECKEIYTDINTPAKTVNMSFAQVDATNFPTMKLYVNIKQSDKAISGIDASMLKVTQTVNNGKSENVTLTNCGQLDGTQNLNINLIADVSSAETATNMSKAKEEISSFLDTVQFESGDKVELTKFSDDVEVCQAFSQTREDLKVKAAQLQIAKTKTSLYDALYAGINRTASQSGAKCVIAFVSAKDNGSKSTASQVIEEARHYNIPVSIITIGNTSNSDYKNICTQTGGTYKNIKDASTLSTVYQDIYTSMKQMYVLEYTATGTGSYTDQYGISISLSSRKYTGKCNNTFTPNVLSTIDTDAAASGTDANGKAITDEAEKAVANYLGGFVNAMNSHDYSKLSPYVVSGSPIATTQEAYIKNDIKETLKSYEIISKTQVSDTECKITVRETYAIDKAQETLKMLVQEATYVVQKDSSGKWLVYDFDGSVNVIQNIGGQTEE